MKQSRVFNKSCDISCFTLSHGFQIEECVGVCVAPVEPLGDCVGNLVLDLPKQSPRSLRPERVEAPAHNTKNSLNSGVVNVSFVA